MKITKEDMAKRAIGLFYVHGYEHTTIDDICKACGVTKGSFYHHFKSKEDLLPYIYKSSPFLFFQGSLGNEKVEASPKKQLWRMFEMFFNYTVYSIKRETMKNFWDIDLLSGNRNLSANAFLNLESLNEDTLNAFINNIERAKELGEIHSDIPAREMLYAFFSAMFGISVNWSHSLVDSDVTSNMKRAFDVIFR